MSKGKESIEASPSKEFKSIGIFGSFMLGVDKELLRMARDVGMFLATQDIEVIYSGGRKGLAGLIAAATVFKGGKATGVIPDTLSRSNIFGASFGNEIVVSSMQEQMKEIFDRADAFIIVPGGFETLQAGLQVAYWGQMNVHQKPIGVLNVNGLFNDLFTFFDQMINRQLMSETARKILISAPTIEELYQKLQGFQPELEPDMDKLNWNDPGDGSKKRKLDLTLRL